MAETFLDGKVTLHRGDCLEVLPLLEADSIDSCVTDPPYHLTSIVKRYSNGDARTEASIQKHGLQSVSPYMRGARGFMGKQWDGGDVAFRPELWVEVLRVLKPGAHLIAFGGTRTYHRMACAIEDAGFEIRDQIGWCYGSGFPKSHDVSKGIDRLAGAEREVVAGGIGSKTGATYSIDGGYVAGRAYSNNAITDSARHWQGWGTALKPAWEPIVLARKPLSESSIAANVLKHGTGGINVDGCRVGTTKNVPASESTSDGTSGLYGNGIGPGSASGSGFDPNVGRWPANLIHDGSEEVLAGFPETAPSMVGARGGQGFHNCLGRPDRPRLDGDNDSGSAARFFYTAKADVDDRQGSKHPTVKPIDLMQYLVRLVTPKGGVVLDPFAGTGSLGEAAFYEGMRAVLIEREPEYQADIVKRMGLCLSGPDLRRASSVKQESAADLPLFGGAE